MQPVHQQVTEAPTSRARRPPDVRGRVPAGGRHADLLALQRLAGNQATAALLGRGPATPVGAVVQRRSLTQAGLPEGVAASAETKALVGADRRLVRVYTMVHLVPQNQMNEVDALVLAAKMSASVGTAIRGRQFTRPHEALDDDQNPHLDPFMLKVTVLYNSGPQPDVMTVTYQHAHEFTGYVVELTDSGNRDVQGATMFRDAAAAPTDLYSNRHDTRDRQNISQLLVGGTQEKSYDAYTKIAGEGARWQCVARHAHFLNDDSRFFVRSRSREGVVWCVTFRTLWLHWASEFDKEYDVPDDRVVERIRNNGFSGQVHEARLADMTWKDYDLENHRTHTR